MSNHKSIIADDGGLVKKLPRLQKLVKHYFEQNGYSAARQWEPINARQRGSSMGELVDRKRELEALEREYQRETASFVVVYGRRRVGKTTTIEHFMQGKRAIYFLATEELESANRDSFKNIVAKSLNNPLLASARVDRWEDVFGVIADAAGPGERIVIVLDEFQYLGKANAAFPSVLQRIWDTRLKEANVMLVLCGSLIRMMHSQTLSHDSPLYGRRTAQLNMGQIPFAFYHEFFGKASERQLVERFAVTGGVPKYIELFPARRDVLQSIRDCVLDPSGFLYAEPEFLLSREVGDVGTYFSILRAIAAGNQRPGNIASILGMKQTSLSKYLSILIELGLVQRNVPATEKNPAKSKRGRYRIADNFLRFWFRYVLPYASYIESGHADIALNALRTSFVDGHVSFVYEDVCREAAWALSASGDVPFALERVGRWWDDKNAEVDVVGIGESNALVGECKFWKGPVGANVLYDLQDKAAFMNLEGRRPFFAIFSMAGFTPELQRAERQRDDLLLVKGTSWVHSRARESPSKGAGATR